MKHNVPSTGTTERCRVGTYEFGWTDEHITLDTLEKLKHQYDELGAGALLVLQKIAKAQDRDSDKRLDLYGLLKDHHANDPLLDQFWKETHSVPTWVDWTQIKRGQRVFYKHMLANFVGFALQGFLGENAASRSVAEVLVKTGGFSTRVLLRRLMETFSWLLQVTKDLEAVKPGGEGHISTIRVRLLHSMVRQRVLRLASNPDYFSVADHGVPVNTRDSMHSITTFSCNPMWLQLPKMGIYPSTQDIEDYVALFRYLAHVIGTPTDHFSSVTKAKACMESMLFTLEPSENGTTTVHNFIECFQDVPPLFLSRSLFEAGSRVLNGHEHCDAFGIGRATWLDYARFRGLCWLLQALSFAQKLSPFLDRYVTDCSRSFINRAILESSSTPFGLSGKIKYGFKHHPDKAYHTGKEDKVKQSPKHRLWLRPVESVCDLCFFGPCLVVFSVVAVLIYSLLST